MRTHIIRRAGIALATLTLLAAATAGHAYQATGYVTSLRNINGNLFVRFNILEQSIDLPACHNEGDFLFRTSSTAEPLLKELLMELRTNVTIISTDECEAGVQTIKSLVVPFVLPPA